MDAKQQTRNKKNQRRSIPTRAVPVAEVSRRLRKAEKNTRKAEREVKSLAVDGTGVQSRGERRRKSKSGSLEDKFINDVMYPDLTGPQVLPLQGAGDRVVTGLARSTVDLYCTSTYGTNIVWMNPFGLTGQAYYFANTAGVSSPFSTNQGTGSWDVSFPAYNQVQDYVPTTGCITAEWLGAVLNTGGSVLVGNMNSGISNTQFGALTYSILRNLPGSVEFELAEVMEQGMIRIPFVHQGPQSWNFSQPPNNAQPPGINWPFVCLAGAPVGNANPLRLTIEMNFMSHVADNSTSITYDSAPRNYTSDSDSFQNALAKIGSTALDLITLGFPELKVVRNFLPEWDTIKGLFSNSPKAAYKSIHNSRIARLQKQFPNFQVHRTPTAAICAPPELSAAEGKEEVDDPVEHIKLAEQIRVLMSPKPGKGLGDRT